MATTKNYYTGNGSTTAFTFTFPYLNTNHIKVKRDGVVLATTEYTLTPTSNPTTVNFNTAPTNLVPIEIYRETSLTTANNVFAAGSSVKAASLNNNQTQALYALEEQENSIERGEIFNYANANHSAGATAPNTPNSGDTWFDTTGGRTYIYYEDVDSSQWVEANPPFDATGDRPFQRTETGGAARTWDSKLQDIISVKDFGATGDGTTDDSTALSNALTAVINKTQGALFIPAGVYVLNAAVVKTIGQWVDITIYGEGEGVSIFKITNTTGGISITAGIRNSAVNIRDLSIVVDDTDTGYGFKFVGNEGGAQIERRGSAHNIFIGYDQYSGSNTGSIDFPLEYSGLYRNYISNVVINCAPDAGSGTKGINIDGSYKAHITNCYVNGAYDRGISDEGTNGEGGYLTQTTVNGAKVGYYRKRTGNEPELWVKNSHFHCSEVGVQIDGVKYFWLINNLMYSKATSGTYKDFYIQSGTAGIISGNIYRDAADTPYTNRNHILLDETGLSSAGKTSGILIKEEKLQAQLDGSGTDGFHVKTTSTVSNIEIIESEQGDADNNITIPTGLALYDLGSTDVLITSQNSITHIGTNASIGPEFKLKRLSASPAAADSLGQISWYGYDSAGNTEINYGSIKVVVDDVTNSGTESQIKFYTKNSDTTNERFAVSTTGPVISQGTERTIASGAITITHAYHTVDTEGDASTDDLTAINSYTGDTSGFATGQILILRANNASRTVVVKDTGNLKLAGDFSLDNNNDTITLIWTGSNWAEISRSDNAS